jgi:PAS domain S-box-containing protein
MHFAWKKPPTIDPELQAQLGVLQRKLVRSERAREQAELLIDEATRTLHLKSLQLAQREEDVAQRLDRTMRQLVDAQKLAKVSTIYAISPSNIKVTEYFNEIFGFSEAIPATLERILARVHPLDIRLGRRVLSRARRIVGDQRGEIRIQDAKGRTLWVQFELKRVADGKDRFAIIGTLIDITEQRRAERHARVLRLLDKRRIHKLDSTTSRLNRALLQTDSYSSYLTAVLDSVSIGVAVFDENRLLVSWNEQLEQISGVAADQLYNGMSIDTYADLHDFNFKGRRSDPEFDELFKRNIQPLNIQRQRSENQFLSITLNPAEDGKLVICYSDISEQKFVERRLSDQGARLARQLMDLNALSDQLEKARAQAVNASAAKSRFLAMMSHDIRTPLNGLLGMLALIQEEDLPHHIQNRLKLANNSGHQLRVLLDDIIDFARSETQQLRLETSPIDLRATAEQIVDFWTDDARALDAELILHVAEDLPHQILLDPVRLRQILDNFISNALKYGLSENQPNLITIRVTKTDGAGQPILSIEVEDRGNGIDDAHQQAVFADYQQLTHADTNAKGDGFGLGLAICRRIAELQDGEVGFTRNAFGGASFWLRLPLVAAPDRTDMENEETVALPVTAPLSGSHVLIAEDLETNRIVLSAMLDGMGISYAFAVNGKEAVDLWERESFDAILMDISMPIMDGIQATAVIRARESAGHRIPIIGVTAHSPADIQHTIINGGLDAILVKPIQKGRLVAVMIQFLGEHNGLSNAEAATPNCPDARNISALYHPLIDESLLSQFLDDGAIPPPLLSAIINDVRQASDDFIDGVRRGDRDATSAARHKLKGLTKTFGLSGLRTFLLARQSGDIGDDTLNELATLSDATTGSLLTEFSPKKGTRLNA